MIYDELKKTITDYNWDDGFDLPKKILNNEYCDLALALEIFYLADGLAYLEDMSFNSNLQEWSLFISNLYDDILIGRYKKSNNTFYIPLSNVCKYKLRKKLIPEIFLQDI